MVLRYLNPVDLARVTVSKRLRELADADPLWDALLLEEYPGLSMESGADREPALSLATGREHFAENLSRIKAGLARPEYDWLRLRGSREAPQAQARVTSKALLARWIVGGDVADA